MRQGAAVHHEELEHVVERGGVRQAVAGHREHLLEIVAQRLGPAQRLARAHPVDVAAQGVDLAVVGDVAIRVRERPGREGVGAEPLVDERERRLEVGIGEIGEHRLDLVRAEHALVDERVRAEARHVGELVLRNVERDDRLFEELADHVELALEVGMVAHGRPAADEDLHDVGLDRQRAGADQVVVGRHLAPAEEMLAFLLDDRVQERAHDVPLLGVARQEHEAAAVVLGRRQGDAQAGAFTAEELVRNLDEDARAVAGVRLATAGTTMEQVDQDRERTTHDRVRTPPFDVHDESDAAGVVLVAGVVQTLSGRRSWRGWSTLGFRHLRPLCENSCTIRTGKDTISHPQKVG